LSCPGTLLNKTPDDLVESFRLFPIAEMAGLVDDVHLRDGRTVSDEFKEGLTAP
jgi:hypothetical protein